MNNIHNPDCLIGFAIGVHFSCCVEDSLGHVRNKDGLLDGGFTFLPQRHTSGLTTPKSSVVPQESICIAIHVRWTEDDCLGKRFPNSLLSYKLNQHSLFRVPYCCGAFSILPRHLADKVVDPSFRIRGSGFSAAFKDEMWIIRSTPHSLAIRAMVCGPDKRKVIRNQIGNNSLN